jgi:hypothetical protein
LDQGGQRHPFRCDRDNPVALKHLPANRTETGDDDRSGTPRRGERRGVLGCRRGIVRRCNAELIDSTNTCCIALRSKADELQHQTNVVRSQEDQRLFRKILVSHYENNYTGAVKRLNAITEQLAALDYAKAPVFLINGLKREELIAANSLILHELYFAGLGEESRPGPALADAIGQDFGSFDRWRAEFAAMGKAQGGGSGWVLLTWNPHDKAW